IKPDVVVNAAVKKGTPNIDWCEDHKPETLAVNTQGAINILLATQAKGIYMVHLGSGCIFDNVGYDKPVTETDPASPPSFYSWTKYWADEVLKKFPVLILRLRLPINSRPDPGNLITKLSHYNKIIDVENSATVLDDFLYAMDQLVAKRKTGIYNVVNPGTVKYRDLMPLYQQIVDPNYKYQLIAPEELFKQGLAKAGRSNCVLSTAKLEAEGIKLRPIDQALKETLKEYAKNL
ncbi:sugar nucleotide-binding protein, partial [Candidatus Uhrbacteria bacterium]|nr:sugar nucleotide-binding protein [Candidatus Uhrbacteria bacterium]